MKKLRLPSPATVLAGIALFVALGGTAVAAGIVPKAKFALNAGKLQGQTAAQVAAQPGPASTAASLVTTRTAGFSLAAQRGGGFTATCAAGEKAIAGGFSSPQLILQSDSAPTADGSGWQLFLLNVENAGASGTVYAVCLK